MKKRPVGYRSMKHPMLEWVFRKYFHRRSPQRIITFYLSDISDGYRACNIREPISISNTILDLCRRDNGIKARLPDTIIAKGYDLRKKTGQDSDGHKYAGEFVWVGVGNMLKSWLNWPDDAEKIIVSSTEIPDIVLRFIRPDEGGLFSIMDYTNILSRALHQDGIIVLRVQNPMKWQPNEIDGLYVAEVKDRIILYPTEAKSLVTHDDINLDQLRGGYNTCRTRLSINDGNIDIQPLAVRMIPNGIDIAIFPINTVPEKPERFVRILFNPPITHWT